MQKNVVWMLIAALGAHVATRREIDAFLRQRREVEVLIRIVENLNRARGGFLAPAPAGDPT
jgi:hypothetical protein